MLIIGLISAAAIFLAPISVMILRIEGSNIRVRHNSLCLSLRSSSAPLEEQLTQLKAKAWEQYRNSLLSVVAGYIFVNVVIFFIGDKHEGLLTYSFTCFFILIHFIWLQGIWHYGRYRGARLSVLLDARQNPAEQI